MEGTAFWVAAFLASIFVGLSKGGLPVVAMLSVPLLAFFIHPLAAAGLLLPVYIVSDMVGLWVYRREFSGRILAIFVPAAIVGVAIGWGTAALVPEWVVTLLIGVIGALSAASLLLRAQLTGPPRKPPLVPGLLWGVVSGFSSFVSHSGGPPYQIYALPLRLEKMVFAGTATIAFAIINAVKLVPYYALGQLSGESLHIAAFLLIPACLAVLAGAQLVRILPAKLFFQIITWTLLLVSLELIRSALMS